LREAIELMRIRLNDSAVSIHATLIITAVNANLYNKQFIIISYSLLIYYTNDIALMLG